MITTSQRHGTLTSRALQLLYKIAVTTKVTLLPLALQIYQERREMQSMSDAVLHDIGLDRSTARREANRSFFDLPGERLTDIAAPPKKRVQLPGAEQ